jgi:5-methylcytosine-specific restriction endonuclease McrA
MTYCYTYPRPMFRLSTLFPKRVNVEPSIKPRRDSLSLPSNTQKKASPSTKTKTRKEKIPAALREQVWIQKAGKVFEKKCNIVWCENTITAFDFQCGHNIPESKGGKTTLENLIPICSRCNLSMSDKYSIDEWNELHTPLHPSNPIIPSLTEKAQHGRCLPWCL